MKTLRVALWLACLLAAGPLAALEVGDAAPELTFEKSWNTPENASALSALKGRVVFLEIFKIK